MLPLPAAGAGATGDTAMSSTQLIEQCATRLRGIVEALDNIHDNTPHRWSTDLDDVHSSAESLLALIKDQAPARSEASFEEWLANELEGEDGQPVPAAVCDIALARRAFNHWPKLEQPAKVGGVRFSAGVSSRLVVEAAQRLYEFESTPEQEAERIERLQAFREQLDPLNLAPHAKAFNEAPAEALKSEQAEAELEKQEPVGEVRESGGTLTAVIVRHSYATKLPVGTKLYAAPVALAQHSVPDGFREKFKQCMELAFAEIAYYVSPEKARDPNSRARKASALATELLDMLAGAPGTEVPQAWLDVQVERRRQVEAEGWTPEHDDEHSHGELADAAACYALWAGGINPGNWREFWPWAPEWLKHSEPRRMLVKAAALILAEIQRLDRAAAAGKEVGHE